MKGRGYYSSDYPILFRMMDSADHRTGKTGLTPTVTLSKNGGSFAAAVGTVSEVGNGWYSLAGDAGDRDTLGSLLLHATAPGADPCDDEYTIGFFDPFRIDLGSAMLDNTISSVPSAVATQIGQQLIEIDNLHKIGLELRGLEIATPRDDSYIVGGNVLSGTVANTRVLDDSVWEIGNATSIDIRLVFDVPVGAAFAAVLIRMVSSNTTTVSVSNDDTTWTSLGTPPKTPVSYRTTLFFGNVVADDGKLYIQLSVSYYAPIWVNVDYAVVLYSSNSASGLTAQETVDAVYNLAPTGTPASGSVGLAVQNIDSNMSTLGNDMSSARDEIAAVPAAVRVELATELAYLDAPVSEAGGGSGLTAQETRDAMKLAPSSGSPAAGSIDAELDAIRLITDAIDTSAVTVTTSNNAGQLTLYRGVTFIATVSGLTISASWTKVYLTIKSDLDLADTASVVQVVETNPGAGTDGLLYLNGAAPVVPITYADAALVVNQAGGTVAITLSDNMTAQLARARSLHWDLKQIVSGTTSTLLATGSADVELTPTRTI